MDKEVFLENFMTLQDDYFRLAMSFLRNCDDASDAVCEMSLKAWEHRTSLKNNGSFRMWTFTILANICRTRLKKTNIIRQEAEGFVSDSNNDVREAVNSLPEKYRNVILLRYYNDMTIKDTAKVLKIPEGTVKSRLNKAHQLLRKGLGDD